MPDACWRIWVYMILSQIEREEGQGFPPFSLLYSSWFVHNDSFESLSFIAGVPRPEWHWHRERRGSIWLG